VCVYYDFVLRCKKNSRVELKPIWKTTHAFVTHFICLAELKKSKEKLSGTSGYHGDEYEDVKVRIMFHIRALKEYLNLRNKTSIRTCIKYVFIHVPLLVLLLKFKYTQVLIYQTTPSTSQKACHYEHSINKQTRLFGS
jgi:hypothetical protein